MKTTLTLALILLPACLLLAAGGPLTPPGAPASTMKSLDEVEPRTPLIVGEPGVATDLFYEFIISLPGSYYLTANLDVSKNHGIQINAAGVTLDLMGFEVARTGGPVGGNGIEITSTSHRTTVHDGSLRSFQYGLRVHPSGGRAKSCAFRNLAASACTNTGIAAGEGSVLESCRAYNCTGANGLFALNGSTFINCTANNNPAANAIYANNGCTLINCSATGNTGTRGINASFSSSLINCSAMNNEAETGIFADSSSSLTNCTAYNNTGSDPSSAGIETGTGCTLTNCTSNSNTSTAPPTATTGMGFDIGDRSTIQNCTASSNLGNGILLSRATVARKNTSSFNGNGIGGDGAGIHVNFGLGDNHIEGNTVTDNDRGIDVDVADNLIIKNSATGNTIDYDIVADNKVGVIVSALNSPAISGSAGGIGVGTTDPFANLSY